MPLPGQHAHEFILRPVRVLIFVDQQILKTVVVILANVRRRFQQPHRLEQQVIEVERVRLAQLLPVLLIQMRNLLRLRIRRVQIKLLRIEHVILRPRNPPEHGARGQFFIVDAQPLHDRFHNGLLVTLIVDHEILRVPDRRLSRHGRRNPHRLNVAPQHPHAERMKRRDHRLGDAQSAYEPVHARAHLPRRLIGERHGQNRFRHDALVLDQVSDPVGDDTRLPAPGAGQNEHRPLSGLDSLALLRIQLIKKRQ